MKAKEYNVLEMAVERGVDKAFNRLKEMVS